MMGYRPTTADQARAARHLLSWTQRFVANTKAEITFLPSRWNDGRTGRLFANKLEEVFEMDKEHIKGAADHAKGSVKEAAGKMTGDKEKIAEGKMDKAKGEAHKAVGDTKDAVREATKKTG